ncbi:MAG TPA: ABC transporter ATP-binding protein [Pseudomonadota bacterium]|jgi:putative ABC transport system ATP-binding protein|nr:ABC transporter ATP-binding protein [Pseudomonadota bacterium]
MSEPVLRLSKITKVYSRGDLAVHALRGVDLTLFPGEFVAVMGPSGSGKSTLMNLIGCLDRPTEGSYELLGRDVSKLSRDDLARVRLRTLGFVFQGFNLLSRTTALENVELPLLYAGLSAKDRATRAQDALARVGLSDRGGHTPNQLSGGQQQRVAIARALVSSPTLLLADEPTGNLDSRTSLEVMALLQKLNAEGLTILLVTHEPDIAAFAKRLLVVKDGRIRKDEPVQQHNAEQALAEWRAEPEVSP